ncbi:MAG TPA: 3-hydroxyacyl-ACP dehydratase [Puia sp.]|nr:3-hydroxyacyl-ACP dehydratase [Puia sp.]
MLKNDLYTMEPYTEINSVLQVPVKINSGHAIFKGHFPGQPIFPGVCMLEMIQEIMEVHLDQKLRISRGPLIKFLSMIIPEKNPLLLVDIQYEKKDGKISASGKIHFESTIFMKYNLELIPAPV